MNKKTMRARLLASSMICAAAFVATSAYAADADEPTTTTELVVTGSRIPQPNMVSVSPVQVVTSEEFKQTGQADTIDLLNDLPQVSQNDAAGFSSTSNPLSSPGGVATVDLRGIGPQRTLVLIDGRRLGIGDPNTGNNVPAPDINQIPSQLIERVDVLTGGASAVYGSDAIAGVVNFILRRNFEGLQFDVQYGKNQHNQHDDFSQGLLTAAGIPVPGDKWDGRSVDISAMFGMNSGDGKGNVTGYFVYHDQDPVRQFARDFSACQLNTTAAGVASCGGSSNSNIWYTADGTSDAFAVSGTNFVPYGTPGTTPPPLFNSNAFAYILHGDTRYTGGYLAHYEINEHFDVYSDFQFMADRSQTEIAPSGLFQASGNGPSGGFFVNCNNPLMSAQQQGTFCTPAQIAAGDQLEFYIGRRNIEGGGRQSYYNHDNYRLVLGTRGVITGPWRYDLYGSYYYTSFYQDNERYLSISRIQNALLVGGTAANPVCLGGQAGCIPFNIFRDGGVTQEQLAYLYQPGTAFGSVRETIVEGVITGDLGEYGIKSPWATDGVGVAVGAQNRRDTLRYAPDAAELSGDLSGFGGASTAINNTIRVNELFGEIRIPIVQDRPFFHDLRFEAGYRYSDYSTDKTTDTYKFALQWAPIEELRFRGSFQQAIRAASITELYTPQAVTNTSQLSADPCSPLGGVAATATLAQCQLTGVTPAQYGNGLTTNTIAQCPAGQCAVLLGGNPDLTPEKARTYALGFTVRPSGMFEGFTGSVDWWRIDLSDLVGAIPLGVIMDNCLNSGDPVFCSQIHRAPNGTLFGTSVVGGGYLTGTNVNIGAGKTSGVDVQANYRFPLERVGADTWGTLNFAFSGSYLIEAKVQTTPAEPIYDCAGLFGPQCQTLNPRWRHGLRVTWQMPWHLQTSINWRYVGSTLLETQSDEPRIGGGAPLPAGSYQRNLEARHYFDVSAQWEVHEGYVVRAGIANILDQDPPLMRSAIVGTGLPNTYSSYDLLGRRMFVGLTATF